MTDAVFVRRDNPHHPEHEDYQFHCPGCKCSHFVRVAGMPSPWTWNGDLVKPTVSPSILVRSDFDGDRPSKICHSFIRDGRIEFLGDCTHALAGQTIALEPVDGEGGRP